jgi:hypothetical protein
VWRRRTSQRLAALGGDAAGVVIRPSTSVDTAPLQLASRMNGVFTSRGMNTLASSPRCDA